MIQRASFALFESKRSTGKFLLHLTDDHIKTVLPLIGEQMKISLLLKDIGNSSDAVHRKQV